MKKRKNKDEYDDFGFCEKCRKNTDHKFLDGGHERDSSQDKYECYECGNLTQIWEFKHDFEQ